MTIESEPLLSADETRDPNIFEEPIQSQHTNHRSRQQRIWHQSLRAIGSCKEHFSTWKNIYLCALFLMLLEFPTFYSIAPGLQLMEIAICRQFHGEDMTTEICQDPEVQSRLANVRGALSMLTTIPSLILAVPYGMLADSYGRRLVAGLTVFAAILCFLWSFCVYYFYRTLSFNLIFVFPLFLWIGGGGYVAASCITAIAADVVPNEESRTRAFFLLGVMARLMAAIAPPVGAQVMHRHGPYTAFFWTIPTSFLAFIPLIFIPETIQTKSAPDETDTNVPSFKLSFSKADLQAKFKTTVQHFRTKFLPLLKSARILVGLFTFLMGSFSLGIGEIIMQYMKIRFGWAYEQSTTVMAFSGAIHIVMLCTILPLAHKALTKYFSVQQSDLLMSKISITFDVIGTLIFGVSDKPAGAWVGVTIGALGSGLGGAMRAFMTSLIPKHDVTLLYTLISTAAAIGSLFAAPVMQLSLSAGIRIGGAMVGLPFFIITALLGLAMIAVWMLQVPRIKLSEEQSLDDDVEEDVGVRRHDEPVQL